MFKTRVQSSLFKAPVLVTPQQAAPAAGPFIGPRGGKWADPDFTIPWHEGTGRSRTVAPEPTSQPSMGHPMEQTADKVTQLLG